MTNCPVTVRVKIAAHEGKQDAIFKCARRKWAIIRSLGPVGVVSGGVWISSDGDDRRIFQFSNPEFFSPNPPPFFPSSQSPNSFDA